MTQGVSLSRSAFSPGFNSSQAQAPSVPARNAPTSAAHELPMIDRSRLDPKIVQAAEGMEAMFIDHMMKVMRETIPQNEMDLESPATKIYRSMQDSEYAQKAAHRGCIGLSDQIIAYLSRSGYDLPKGQGVPTKEKP